MHLRSAFPKNASGKKFSSACIASGANRSASRAASEVWSRRRRNRVGVICYADHLGTPRAITRPSDNAVVWRWDNTDPFGANLPNENPSGLGTFKNNNRFPGQYYDEETGTHFNWNRDYDPATGRYIQSDAIGLAGGINTYGYVEANPISKIDPTGELAFLLPFLPAICGGTATASSMTTALVGGLSMATILSISGDSPKKETKKPPLVYPEKPGKRGTWRCNCQCFANTQAGCPSCTVGFGYGEGDTMKEARNQGEREAKRNLGMQTEHCICLCINAKGDKFKTVGGGG